MSPLRSSIQVQVNLPHTNELPESHGRDRDSRELVPPGATDAASQRPRVSASSAGSEENPVAQPILDFVASDETLDRFGEVIAASGWRLDTYRRNPVFQNAHQYGDIMFTLGRALITEVRSHSRPDGRGAGGEGSAYLFQRIQFATDVNPVARVAYGLYKAKFLNAVSVGFIPLRWEDAPPGGTSSASPQSTRPRRRYLEQELLEVSAVGIPANPNALALGLKSGAIERGDLREMLGLLLEIRRRGQIGSTNTGSRQQELLNFARELHRILRRA